MSGQLTKETLLKFKKMGVKGFLSKPFEIENLYNMVGNIYSAKIEYN